MTIRDVKFETSDLKKMIELMSHHKDFPMPLAGKNDEGETIIIEICKNNIIVRTYQHNNWCRTNIYWKDGTVEELYDK